MYYYQEITYIEHISGRQTIRLAVSDNIAELFSNDISKRVNIFNLNSIKQDLNLGEGKFAIDEVSFTINQAMCNDNVSESALNFVLQCQNKANIRYCAVNIISGADALSVDNNLIIAKIDTNVNANDLAWDCDDYSSDINALRDYSFTAKTLDISLLDECLFTEVIKVGDNIIVPNIYDRIDKTDINSISRFKTTTYFRKPIYIQDKYKALFNGYYPYKVSDLVPLGKAVKLYLNKAELLIKELHNVDVKFNLTKSNLGIHASPILYTLLVDKFNNKASEIDEHYVNTDVCYNLFVGLSDEELEISDTEFEPYVSAKMLMPEFGFDEWFDPFIVNADLWQENYMEQEKERISAIEQPHTFKALKSVSDFLYKLAKEFNCYISTTQTIESSELVTNIEFKSKVTFNNENKVSIINATVGNVNTEFNKANDVIYYYSVVNSAGAETLQILPERYSYGYPFRDVDYMPNSEVDTKRYIENYKLKEIGLNGAKLTKSLFATSILETYSHRVISDDELIEVINGKLQNAYYVENSRPINTALDINDVPDVAKQAIRTGTSNPPSMFSQLTTCLYIHSPHIEETQQDIINGAENTTNHKPTRFMRPIARYYVKVNNNSVSNELGQGTTLTDLINLTNGYEREFYKSEYSITIPCWNGFAKNNDIDNISWRNIELGSIINLSNIDYIVVSKEINLSKPETTIKLQSLSRFAYKLYKEQ